MSDIKQRPKPVEFDLPSLGEQLPCDDVITVLPRYAGAACATVGALRVTYRHDHGTHTRDESWMVCEPCFAAMDEFFAGTVLHVHRL